jgi:hypothetical protein
MSDGFRLEYVDIFYGHLDYSQTFGIFYDHLVHFVFIWYIFSALVSMQQKYLATLCPSHFLKTRNPFFSFFFFFFFKAEQ